MTSVALDVGQMKNIAIGVVIALVLGAVLVGFVIQELVAKLVVALVLVGLGVAVWTQRSALGDCASQCDCSFFGYELTIDDPNLRARCQDVAGTVS